MIKKNLRNASFLLILLGVMFCLPGCQKEELNPETKEPLKTTNPVVTSVSSKNGDILTYTELLTYPGLTIYTAPSTYVFSKNGLWPYTEAKLAYNSVLGTTSEVYVFGNEEDYINAGCDRSLTKTTTTVGTQTVTFTECTGTGTDCEVSNNCIIICTPA